MDMNENSKRMSNLNTLKLWANQTDLSHLNKDRKKEVTDKLDYGYRSPHTEYDTVINQILIWLHQWNFPIKNNPQPKPVVNALFEEVSKYALNAYNGRINAKRL
jgi:hypothetical protein